MDQGVISACESNGLISPEDGIGFDPPTIRAMVIDQGRAARPVESVAVNFAVSESTAHRWAPQDRLKAHRPAVSMDRRAPSILVRCLMMPSTGDS